MKHLFTTPANENVANCRHLESCCTWFPERLRAALAFPFDLEVQCQVEVAACAVGYPGDSIGG
jgi:hypothetical protein